VGKNESKAPLIENDIREALRILEQIRCPGLTQGFADIKLTAEWLLEFLPLVAYKEGQSVVWVALLGGTGTGKSTIFNALCRLPLSATGIERPMTSGAIGYAHKDTNITQGFPFFFLNAVSVNLEDIKHSLAGNNDEFLIILHNINQYKQLVIVDTPDLDSLEPENRRTAEKFSSLADAVVFVTSQEKYADDAPYQLLKREVEYKKPCFLLVNKTSKDLTRDEIAATLQLKEIPDNIMEIGLLPYVIGETEKVISNCESFNSLREFILSHIQLQQGMSLLPQRRNFNREKALDAIGNIVRLIMEEQKASDNWEKSLAALAENAASDLISLEEKRFASQSREYIKNKIQMLFQRYDLLAKPRKVIREIILLPLKMLGIIDPKNEKSREEILARMKEKGPVAPLRETIESLSREVLRDLSPAGEETPLYRALREKGVRFTGEELEERLSRENQKLLTWLEETFSKLSRDITGVKKWGIYTTSILWGILILVLETVVGGGFTVLDALLGSALAPFVTKGATELFASHEIRKTAQELARLHKEGLLSIVEEQRARYWQCLARLTPPKETVEILTALEERLNQ